MSSPRFGRVVVVGAGTMGHGIAQVAAMAGSEVVLCDAQPAALQRGLAAIAANLDKGVARGKVDAADRDATLARLRGEADLAAACAGADLLVEAVPENVELKRRVFAAAGAALPPGAVVATNTSSIPLRTLADALPDPSRFCGMHFFNPVHIQPLLEVVQADSTSEETITAVVDYGRALGKEPIVVRDVAGFASSRLGLALGLEAIRMLEQGVASAADIDKAMTLGYRHPMGPLALTDLVGLDVRLAIAETLAREIDPVRFSPPQLLRDLVAAGKLGKKSGEGFYRYASSPE
ncbi:MAG: hypothetical protein RIT45_2397 [Pseudomonadota bacterium]|jgi:3-hydroxybutyryl-CoA dehydrogenase